MKIGIDCRTILNPKAGEKAGIGHYTYYLIKNLLKIDKKNEYVLFFDPRAINTDEFAQKNVEIKVFPFFKYKRFLPFSYSHLLISAFLDRQKLDVYHAPANIIPLSYRGKSVVTVHDLAIYDHPEWFPTKFLTNQSFSTKVLVPKSLKKADKIIAVSENTRKDIKRIFGLPGFKIKVIYEGVNFDKPTIPLEKLQKKFKLQKGYIFYVGTLEPRKNLERVVNAFRGLMVNKRFKAQLVLAGNLGWRYQSILKAIASANRREKNSVRYLGYIGHEEKISLIKHARCFIYPSLYEGFGLQTLEAMAQGTPVITSNNSSMPEVAGEAGVLVDPEKTGEIAKAMLGILGNKFLADLLGKKGKIQAKKFSWRIAAEETLEIYKEVLR